MDQIISCDARLCREAASWVRSSFTSRSGKIPHYIQAKNLFRPTRRYSPPWLSGATCERALLSGLLSSPTRLLDDNQLSQLIRQFNWHPQNECPLDVVRTSYRSIVDSGVLYRILRIECHAGESAFQHLSQAWIFTQVLQGFIEHLLEIGMRAEIKLEWGDHQVVAL